VRPQASVDLFGSHPPVPFKNQRVALCRWLRANTVAGILVDALKRGSSGLRDPRFPWVEQDRIAGATAAVTLLTQQPLQTNDGWHNGGALMIYLLIVIALGSSRAIVLPIRLMSALDIACGDIFVDAYVARHSEADDREEEKLASLQRGVSGWPASFHRPCGRAKAARPISGRANRLGDRCRSGRSRRSDHHARHPIDERTIVGPSRGGVQCVKPV
jgi:hypothetical protein